MSEPATRESVIPHLQQFCSAPPPATRSTMSRSAQAFTIQQVPSFPFETIDRLLARYPFPPYRHWSAGGRDVARQILRWDLLHKAPAESSQCWLAMAASEPLGLAVGEPSRWESEQLGTRMVELRHLIVVGNRAQRQEVAEALLVAIKRFWMETPTCLIHRLDSADSATIAALEAESFRLVDTGVSFIRDATAVRSHLNRIFHHPCPGRPYQPEDHPEMEAIVRRSRFGGRLYHDSHLPEEKVDALYREWARLCCEGIFADQVMVAARAGRIGGFISYQLQRDLYEATGIRVVGRGLLAVAPEHRGLAAELIRSAMLIERQTEFFQCDIHLENLELLGMYGRVFRMEVAHVRHVFHGWVGIQGDEAA